MDAEKVYKEIQQLPVMAGQIRQRQHEAISFLQRLYFDVTGSTVYAGCKGCHIKAANYLSQLSLNQLITMATQKFKLKNSNRIEWPFRSGRLITEANITDDIAANMLFNSPIMLAAFSDYPKDENGNLDLSEWYPSEQPEPEKKVKAKKEEVTNG